MDLNKLQMTYHRPSLPRLGRYKISRKYFSILNFHGSNRNAQIGTFYSPKIKSYRQHNKNIILCLTNKPKNYNFQLNFNSFIQS